MAVRKAEVIYVGDAASIVRAAKQAEVANSSLATGIKGSATEIVAAQDRIVAAGNRAAAEAVKAGDSQARAAAVAGRAAVKEAEAVGASTSEQVTAYRRATDAAVKASAEQSAAADRAVAAQVAANKKQNAAVAGFVGGVVGGAKKAGEGLLGLAAVSVFAAVKFQKNMELMHTQAGAPTAEIKKMSKAVLDLGLTTEQGPNALAKALYPLESVGMRGKTAIQALGAAAKGAAVGQADLTETTHALAGVMVALHEKGGDAAKQMGAIDAVVGVGKMTMQDFVQALSSGIVPTAHAVGLSFASMASGLATMTDAGVPAEMAATKMRTILLMLAHEHTKDAVLGLHDVGLTADNLAQAMRKPGNGLLDVLQLLSTHMQGLSKVKKVDLLASLAGGSRSAGTLITLIDQLGRVGNKYGQIQTLSGQFNSRVAAESATASHKIKVAWSIVQTAFIDAGTALLPAVSSILGAIEGFILEMKKGTGAGGQFLDGIKTVASGVKVAGQWMVTAFNDVRTTITTWVNQNQAQLTAFGNDVTHIVTGVVSVLKAVLVPAFNFVVSVTQRVWPAVKQIISGTLDVIRGIVRIFAGIFTGDFSKAWSGVKSVFSGGATAILGIIRAITAPAREIAARIGGAIASGLKSAANAVTGAVSFLVNAGINILKGAFNTLYNIGKYIVKGLISGIGSMVGGVIDAVGNLVSSLPSKAMHLLGINSPSRVFAEIGMGIGEGLVKGLLSSRDMVAAGLNQALLYPVDAAIAALTTKETTLQATWTAIDAAAQKSQLVQAVSAAAAGGGSSSGLGGSQSGSSGASGMAAGTAGVATGVTAMLATAKALIGTQYTWGGGHSGWDPVATLKKIGVDCSGFVSQVLHAGGVSLPGPLTTSGLASALKPGVGKQGVTVWDKTSGGSHEQHTIIQIAGKWFESGGVSGGVGQMTPAQARSMIAGGFSPYHPGSIAGGSAVAATSAPTGKLNANQMRGLLYAGGFRGAALDTAVAIGFAESKGITGATNRNTNGTIDRGFMQINSSHGALSTYNSIANAKAAYTIWKQAGGSFSPWSTFQNGAYRSFTGNTGSGTGTMSAIVKGHVLGPAVPNHNAEIQQLEDQLAAIRKQRINLPIAAHGKAGNSTRLADEKERKTLANETLTIEQKIKALKAENKAAKVTAKGQTALGQALQALKDFNVQAARAKALAKIDLQIKNLTQLKTFSDAIAGLRTQLQGLGQQAAQAWQGIMSAGINNTHDVATFKANAAHVNALAALTPQTQQLAGMQAQDAIDQAEKQLDSLNKAVTAAQKQLAADQTLAAHSGGQTHIDALAAVATDQQTLQDAQQAITDFQRQQDEQRLQDQINTQTTAADNALTTATQAADGAQAIALAGLTQQTTDMQQALDNQFAALTTSLQLRKISYATWAADVNAILSPYGLSASTDPTTEAGVTAGPGPAATVVQVKAPVIHLTKGMAGLVGKTKVQYRASGGPVAAGQPYIVGEQGREMFVPDRPGTVMTASQTRRGGGGGVHIHGNLVVNSYRAAQAMADRLAFRASIGTA